jgi:hypothetical protein
MPSLDKRQPPASPAPAGSELTTGALLRALEDNAGKALIFSYEGRDVLPGYHVTEVKDGRFAALDCGANPESWRETFIQLWDVPAEDGRGFMPAGRFLAIMDKVGDHVPFDPDARLTFEVSDGSEAIRLFRAETIEAAGAVVRIALGRRPASCKPRDRWLEQQRANDRLTSPEPCCG